MPPKPRRIEIPHDWSARPYQRKLFGYLENGGKRAVAVWHRRAGKDAAALNWTAEAAFERVGLYWHMLPTANQGRKVVWDGITKDGRKVIDQALPPKLRSGTNKQEMKIDLANGSVWQVVGSDNYDSLIGANPVGVVFSEYSVAKPAAWDYIRPILAENGGWALFIYTPRGRNHGYELYENAKTRDGWFAQILTADDTQAISKQAIEDERADGMSAEMIEQEFYCSFDAPLVGSYYGKQMADAEKDGRLGKVPWQPDHPVMTAWDLGIGDTTSIWFFQIIGNEIHLIDYYEASGVGLDHYTKVLQSKPYTYADHLFPHDVTARELGTGKTREEVLRRLGVTVTVVPNQRLEDGIDAVRALLPRCWFDAETTKAGTDALRTYRREWDENKKMFRDTPVHDWTSHPADAFRYLALGLKQPKRAGSDYAAPVPQVV